MYAWFHEKHVPWVPELLLRTQDAAGSRPAAAALPDAGARGSRLPPAEIMQTLARIHSLPAPDFLEAPKRSYAALPPERLRECLDGWKSVLAEHGDRFNADDAAFVARHFNRVNERFYPQNFTLVHGDFHCDNLLMGNTARFLSATGRMRRWERPPAIWRFPQPFVGGRRFAGCGRAGRQLLRSRCGAWVFCRRGNDPMRQDAFVPERGVFVLASVFAR